MQENEEFFSKKYKYFFAEQQKLKKSAHKC